MDYQKSYKLSQVGISDLLLDVTKKLNREFNLGTVAIDGFDLNVEPYSQLNGATIRYRNFEPERIRLDIFDPSQRPKASESIIEALEVELRGALERIKSRLDREHQT